MEYFWTTLETFGLQYYGVLFEYFLTTMEYFLTGGGGGQLPNVGYMGMCHQPGLIFHFQTSRTGPEF